MSDDAYAGWMYLKSFGRTMTVFRSGKGTIHIATAETDGTNPSCNVPPLTSGEARALASRLVFLADELDALAVNR